MRRRPSSIALRSTMRVASVALGLRDAPGVPVKLRVRVPHPVRRDARDLERTFVVERTRHRARPDENAADASEVVFDSDREFVAGWRRTEPPVVLDDECDCLADIIRPD